MRILFPLGATQLSTGYRKLTHLFSNGYNKHIHKVVHKSRDSVALIY